MDLSWVAAAVGVMGALSAWAFAVMRERTFTERTKRLARELHREHGKVVRALEQAHLQETLRLQYAQWWANNAGESNTSEGLRFTLLEIALFALASGSMEEVRGMLINRVATERDPERASVLQGALGELELKRPGTSEPWHPWIRHDEERGALGYARWNADVMEWWKGILSRGAYTSRVRVLELAINVMAAAKDARFTMPPASPEVASHLELLVHRRIVSNSRPLPAYGENLQ